MSPRQMWDTFIEEGLNGRYLFLTKKGVNFCGPIRDIVLKRISNRSVLKISLKWLISRANGKQVILIENKQYLDFLIPIDARPSVVSGRITWKSQKGIFGVIYKNGEDPLSDKSI